MRSFPSITRRICIVYLLINTRAHNQVVSKNREITTRQNQFQRMVPRGGLLWPVGVKKKKKDAFHMTNGDFFIFVSIFILKKMT